MATRYRDLQGPVSLQTGLVDNSAARAAQSLAQSFSQFENAASTIGGALREQEGAREGEAAGAAGTPAPRAGVAATTRHGASYNNAAEVSYANKVSIDVAEQLERIEREAETDPILYGEKTKGLLEGTLGDAPAEWRSRLEQHLTPRVLAGAARVARASDQKRKQEGLADYLASEPVVISQLVKTLRELPGEAGDAELARVVDERRAQIDAFVADNFLDPVQGEKMRQDFTAKVDEALSADRTGSVVEDLVATARGDVEAADDMLMELEAREDLTLEEKTAIRGAYREQSELLRFERTRAHMDELANLSRRLAGGEFSGIRAEAGRLYRRGALSPAEYEQYVAAAERNRQAEIEKDADKEAVEATMTLGEMAGSTGLDPGNTDHQKAAEQYFADQVTQGGMKPGDQRFRETALALTQRLNILPKSAESWARVALLSNDPLVAAQAADFMDRVHQAKPNAYAWNEEPKLTALAATLQDNMAAGVDPVQAYELARKTTWDMKDSERAVREQRYKDLVKKDPNVNVLSEKLNQNRGFFQSDLPVPVGAQTEYEGLVRQYYLLTDDIKQARKLAGKQVRSSWGETTVNGKPEITKYPVERMGLTPEVVRADIAAAVEPLGMDPAKVRLVPGPSTDRTKGTTWALGYTDETGMPEIVLDAKNRPLAYALPTGVGFAEAREASRQKNLARAKAERDAELKAEAERRALTGANSLASGLR
jgi:hypothetical protein